MTEHITSHSDNKSNKHAKRLAVALKNDLLLPDLPKIKAVGQGKWAEKILDLAFEHGIFVREDAELAEILSVLEEDNDIPAEAILAVAEILSYVYAYRNEPQPTIDNPFQAPQEEPKEEKDD